LPYLSYLKAELATVGRLLRPDVVLSQIHLGGGTPTLLSPEMIRDLGGTLASFRPWANDLQFSVEIDPTEVDAQRIDALVGIGMNRSSIGVQDFDPTVQDAIGRAQTFAQTRDVVDMLRAAGIKSLNMDILFGLPHQTKARMADSVQRVLSMHPDRVALYGYAHVPWMAKRQVLISADALPGAEERLELFETARRLFVWDGYAEIGIDHFAQNQDSLAEAARKGTLHRNFQGYTDDTSEVLIGVGASAISRFPQGFAQNLSTSSRYSAAVEDGRLATERGHAMTADDRLRADMIERLMCRFELDMPELAKAHGVTIRRLREITAGLRDRFAASIEEQHDVVRLTENSRLIARLAAQSLDAYAVPEGRHSRAL
jgi:oxygen-independent coproporphyrinogen-3 oxidase